MRLISIPKFCESGIAVMVGVSVDSVISIILMVKSSLKFQTTMTWRVSKANSDAYNFYITFKLPRACNCIVPTKPWIS